MGAVIVWAAPPGLVRAVGIGHATLAAGGGTAVQCLPLHKVNGTVTPIAGAACASLQGIFVQLWQGIGVAVIEQCPFALLVRADTPAQFIGIDAHGIVGACRHPSATVHVVAWLVRGD